jgi:predicted lipoprotein with Yx(FWY)xxD motif
MKTLKTITATVLIAAFAAAPLAVFASDKKDDKGKKPYPLETCVVSGEKFGEGGMKTYTFVHEGQEVKLCCKSCLKDFKKDPPKYIKKIQEAEAKAKKKK